MEVAERVRAPSVRLPQRFFYLTNLSPSRLTGIQPGLDLDDVRASSVVVGCWTNCPSLRCYISSRGLTRSLLQTPLHSLRVADERKARLGPDIKPYHFHSYTSSLISQSTHSSTNSTFLLPPFHSSHHNVLPCRSPILLQL